MIGYRTPRGRGGRGFAALAVAAMVVAAPSALAKQDAPPGNSGANPHGGPPGQTGTAPGHAKAPGQAKKAAPAPSTNPSGKSTGKPTSPPGNSGSNKHGGPPGITGSGAPGQAKKATPPPAATPVTPESTPNGPDGKITICHSTGSETNPYVEITISVNGLNGHGGHHDGADIIPAPEGGCPGTETSAPAPAERETRERGLKKNAREPRGDVAGVSESSSEPEQEGDLASAPLGDDEQSANPDNASDGTLPFTGLSLPWLLAIGIALIATGLLARRWAHRAT